MSIQELHLTGATYRLQACFLGNRAWSAPRPRLLTAPRALVSVPDSRPSTERGQPAGIVPGPQGL
jgi:hypothetical protein